MADIQDYFHDDEPPINRALNDLLATAGGDEAQEFLLAAMWIKLGAEALARAGGRQQAIDVLNSTTIFIRDAQPSRPWKK